jgi:hypothetical protein
MVNYNGMPHIQTCLSSLLKQTFDDYEIIVVDNASTDGSPEYIQHNFPSIKLIRNSANLGYAGAIFSVLREARGTYIAPLNMDTEADSRWLSHMVNFLHTHPKAGAVTPKILLFHARDIINTKGLDIFINGAGFCRQFHTADYASSDPEKVSGFSGCSYVIRRDILEKLQGLPDECFMANDDVVISWLVRLMGYDIFCIPCSILYHKYHMDLTPRKLHRLEVNRISMLLYTLKPSTLILLSPFYFTMEILITGYCLLKGISYLQAKLLSYFEIYRNRQSIKNIRQRYEPLLKSSDRALFAGLTWRLNWRQLINTD